jgi:hypothetical protein
MNGRKERKGASSERQNNGMMNDPYCRNGQREYMAVCGLPKVELDTGCYMTARVSDGE